MVKTYNKKTKTKKFKTLKCAPNKKLSFTCFTKEQLTRLKKLWNTRHYDKIIKSNNPKTIWNKLKKYLNSTCDNEFCWLKQNFSKNKIDKQSLENIFRPFKPKSWNKNPYEWLSSVDINRVMKQYENTYNNFQFIGPSPIDYDTHYFDGQCVWDELCNFNLNNYTKKNINKIGIIFNLDKHDEPGSHWVSMFIDIENNNIYFFDSTGDPPHDNIIKLINEIKKQSNNLGYNYKNIINNIQHQYKNTECGVYSLFFIIEMLKGRNFNFFKNKKIKDDEIHKFRNIYFNTSI
jgi:hypothetical protein